MAQPSAAVQAEIEELEDELRFQAVLLESINDSVDNRAEVDKEICDEIKSLQKKLRALKPKKDPPSSTTSTPQFKHAPDPLSPSSQMSNPPTRKRSFGAHEGDLMPFQQNKSRRSSLSPYASAGPATPATPASSGESDFEAFDSIHMREAIDKEKIRVERIKQEKADEQFALNLSQSMQNGGSATPVARPVMSSHSAFDRINGLRPPASFSSSSGKRPTIKPEPSSSGMASSSTYTNSFKIESTIRKVPGSFVSDSESDDLEFMSSKTIEPNSRTMVNGVRSMTGGVFRPPKTPVRPSFSLEAKVAGQAALRRVEAFAVPSSALITTPGPLPGSFPRPSFGQPNNIAYGIPQAYGGANLGAAGSQMYGGTYPGAGGNLQTFGPQQQGDVLNGILGVGQRASNGIPGAFDGHMGSVIDLEDDDAPIFHRPHDPIMGDQYDYIMNDPRKTYEEIQNLLENIRPDSDLPAEDREGTPDGLVYPLYEHQKIALSWMKVMEEGTNKGGILADDMGLGKTISTLALILSRPSTDRFCKTTLIVGPVALVKQWEREIRVKVKLGFRLSVHMVHGPGKKLSWDELKTFDIVLTTYGTVGAEFKRLEKWVEKQERDYDRAPMKMLFPLLGDNSKFYRVVLDEAQMIKSKSTFAARAAKHLRSLTRFCLTGTPMQNNVGELYSLIHFLRIKPYNEWARFQEAFGKLTKGDASRRETQTSMRKLQAVLKAILLRRTKTSLIDGKPILDLPPKTLEVQHVTFNEDEQSYYDALLTKTQIQFNKYLRAGTIGKNYSNVLVLLLRLRQACCHPHLIQDFEEAPPALDDLGSEKMIELAKGLAPDVVARLLTADGFECPVCYDGVTNPVIVIPCGHDTCLECLSKISDNAALQNQNEGQEGGGGIAKCPSCRGKINMTQIIDYTSFKKVYAPDQVEEKIATIDDDSSTQSEDDDVSDSDLDSDSDSEMEVDDRGDLRGFIVPDDISGTEDEGDEGDDEAESIPKKPVNSKKSKSKSKRRKSKGKEKQKTTHVSLAMLKKESSRSAEGRRKYMRYLRKNWEPSAKVDKCVELLERFEQEDRKTIIFSQFVSLLDLLQVPIEKKGWKFERYDGSMNADARNNAIVRFTEKRDVKIMLISLKAGNAGLNLVAASRVVILDPFWNPYIEMQAVDRAYRIGQQNSVEVHRILVEKTVEDRIIELQEQKRKLVESALDEGASKSVGRLNNAQLAYLFGVGAGPGPGGK